MKSIINIILLISATVLVWVAYHNHGANNRTNILLYLNKKIGHETTTEPWKARELSNNLCQITLSKDITNENLLKKTADGIATWQAGCVGLSLLLIFIFFQGNFVIYCFALLASTFSNFVVMPVLIYPWDGPALLFYTLALVLWRYKPIALLALLPLAIGFKETTGMCCVLLLFVDEWKLNKRVFYFMACLILCAMSREYFVWHTGCHGPALQFFTDDGIPYIVYNIEHALLTTFMACSGLLLAVWFTKGNSAVKTLCVLFLAPVFVTGCINELRIFRELTPFLVYALVGRENEK